MSGLLHRLLRLEKGEWPKLVQFGILGFLLQMGLGIGFSAGDAAFFSNVGASQLPIIFLLTPIVMLVYTGAYSFFLAHFSIDRIVDLVLAALAVGGIALWALFQANLTPEMKTTFYYVLKLYLVMWYFALYTLFWSYTDTYFNIQDAKRLFPLFAAFCALGTSSGAALVHLLADVLPMHYFLLIWSATAVATAPLAWMLRRRWSQIQESDLELAAGDAEKQGKLSVILKTFRTSKYTRIYALTLFIILLLTNLIEFQYATVLEASRSEAELAELFGALYAAVSIFNLIVCLFIFNRLVSRFGVRNVAFILPMTYFLVFAFFFLYGGEVAAIAAFFAYHGVLTSIEYNNENLLFNAVPSTVKKPLRAVIEGMCEPLASLLAGGFLFYAAHYISPRELSGIGVIIGVGLIVMVVLLRHRYPAAMAANMRHGSLHFGDQSLQSPSFSPNAADRLKAEAGDECSPLSRLAQSLLGATGTPPTTKKLQANADQLARMLDSEDPFARSNALSALCDITTPEDIHLVPVLTSKLPYLDRPDRHKAITLIGKIGDTETIQETLAASGSLAGRERREIAAMLAGLGETAIPRLASALRDRHYGFSVRSIAACALADLSYAQFTTQADRLVGEELSEAHRLRLNAERLEVDEHNSNAVAILAQAQHERIARAVDFVLELLALSGKLPNFDLLIVSLHSANPKVRANALEAIESSVDYETYRSINVLLRPHKKPNTAASAQEDDIIPLVEHALEFGHGIEAAAAMQILHERLSTDQFIQKVRDTIRSDMPAIAHRQLLKLLGLKYDDEAGVVALVEALRQMPDFAASPLVALTDLASYARYELPSAPSIQGSADGRSFWIMRRDVREVASRHSELALTMLRIQEERDEAA